MNICIPVDADNGLESRVCGHFGSAPAFLIVDTDDESCRAVTNTNRHHGHGMCAPLGLLAGHSIDRIVVSRIGRGAMRRFEAAQMDVYLAERGTVAEVLAALKENRLKRPDPGNACSGHHHGHGHE